MKVKMFGQKTEVGNTTTLKQATFKPVKKNSLVGYRQIEKYVEEFKSKLPAGTSVVVRAEGLLGTRTLYSNFNKKRDWMTEAEEEEYMRGDVVLADKFKRYFNFTITVYEDTPVENMFV
jgi:hypothetical protein